MRGAAELMDEWRGKRGDGEDMHAFFLFSYIFLSSFVVYELRDEVYDYDVLLWMMRASESELLAVDGFA